MKEKKYIISLPRPFSDEDGYPSSLLALSVEDGETIYVVNEDSDEQSAEDWGYTIYFPEKIKDELQKKFNDSLIVEEIVI